jgi:hypothetical protein
VFPVGYELGLYIPEECILHNRENLKSYTALTGWARYGRSKGVSCEVRTGFSYLRRGHSTVTALETSNLTLSSALFSFSQ